MSAAYQNKFFVVGFLISLAVVGFLVEGLAEVGLVEGLPDVGIVGPDVVGAGLRGATALHSLSRQSTQAGSSERK
jgi:hypothetical protein